MEIKRLSEKPFYLKEDQINWVQETFSSMTNEDKIGQLFVLLGDANEPRELEELVRDQSIGGVLFRPDTTEAVKKKYEALGRIAKYPLLNCANLEEGGAGVVTDGTYFGSEMQVAAANDLEMTKKFAADCAEEGKAVGVNWNFAPVVDIDKNFRNPITNVRTFGSDVQRVKENALVYVQELQRRGMAAACKHYPGDGVDYRDQHLHPTYNSLSARDWYDSYGLIYQTLIDAGLMSVMVGHIVAPHVIRDVNPQTTEKDMLPGSLSREMITGVLREKFGFNGLVITDATIMGGYTMAMPRRLAIPATIAAGCDMICFTTDIHEDLQWMKEGLAEGRLTQERLDEAVLRVLAMKAALKSGIGTATEEESRDTLTKVKDWASACADQAITLVKNKNGLIPVSPAKYPKVRLMIVGQQEMYDGNIRDVATKTLEQLGYAVEYYDPFADDLHGTRELPTDRFNVLLLHYPTASNNVTVRPSWCPKHALEIPRFVHEEKTIVISLANPYHLQDVPRAESYINTYTATAETLRLALEKISGQGSFTGVSPVEAFCGLEDTRL